MSYLNGKTVLVTGGTGSFGNAFVEKILSEHSPKKVIIYSRDEMKQWYMQKKFNDERLRFLIGDVRDKDRMQRAFNNVNCVIHAAATKIVPTAEYNPFECIKTNINGAMNVADCSIDNNVEKVVALSTDKACSPINIYGASKLVSDKVFISSNAYAGLTGTNFSVVRYGNVMGSRGSIIPFFLKLPKDSKIPVTDERMTRFMISLEEGVDLVLFALENMKGGETYVKKIPSMKVTDIAESIFPDREIEIIGIRPGEKLHESMITSEDSLNTYEFKEHYIIYPQLDFSGKDYDIQNGKKVDFGFDYSSGNNSEWMTKEALIKWVNLNKDKLIY
tara:strand:+ start:500 stop:1495 length:996 start_codon:yes stop_codon:yes gene_type:complete